MIPTIYKAKTVKSPLFNAGEWFGGYFFKDLWKGEIRSFIKNSELDVEVDETTLCMYTGKKTDKGKEIYSGDICFEEVEEDDGDRRIYFVCVWIHEWSRFIWLSAAEYDDYINEGVQALEENDYYGLDMNKMHYAGNVFDNLDLITINFY